VVTALSEKGWPAMIIREQREAAIVEWNRRSWQILGIVDPYQDLLCAAAL